MRVFVLSVATIFVLAGCAERGHDEIRQWMEESSRDLKGGIPPLPELKPFPVVSYEAADKVDPFNPSRIEPERKGEGGANKPDFDRPREQLESYPLESISYIGVVDKGKSKTRRAIVQADGVVYQVGIGNYLGQNFGRIVAITPTEIVLKEIVQDPSGQTSDWVEREMTLQLRDGAQGKESKK
ncbi:MAG: pilus assembly protein PilP [Rhodocyclaceae bacterium]|jgi:type IV pilus assembly protein PilP|nr:pilus assembly protein PilP [Rhodocyclaceae bacterium]